MNPFTRLYEHLTYEDTEITVEMLDVFIEDVNSSITSDFRITKYETALHLLDYLEENKVIKQTKNTDGTISIRKL